MGRHCCYHRTLQYHQCKRHIGSSLDPGTQRNRKRIHHKIPLPLQVVKEYRIIPAKRNRENEPRELGNIRNAVTSTSRHNGTQTLNLNAEHLRTKEDVDEHSRTQKYTQINHMT